LLSQAAADEPEPTEARRASQQRLAYIKARLAEFSLEAERDPPVPLVLSAEPLLRWTNPLRIVQGDGATFAWMQGNRPVAIASISIRTQGKVFHEFALLGDAPIMARRQERIVWAPRQNALPFAPLVDAPAPAPSPALRLAQMKTLARRFKVTVMKGRRIELRLLPQPLLRYAEPAANILDGAVFSCVEATDPEVLLLVEARSDVAHPQGRWHYSIARMTSQPAEVELEKHVIWTAPGYWNNPRATSDPYVEAFEGIYADEAN
jgi:hypothetical protein